MLTVFQTRYLPPVTQPSPEGPHGLTEMQMCIQTRINTKAYNQFYLMWNEKLHRCDTSKLKDH